MGEVKLFLEERPYYYNSQLLDENDFREEQRFHVNARRMHNQYMHGAGVVKGLTITSERSLSIKVNAGVAIDDAGNEMSIDNVDSISLAKFTDRGWLKVSLVFEEEDKASAQKKNRLRYFVSLIISKVSDRYEGITLAELKLDYNDEGELYVEKISYNNTPYTERFIPGSITPEHLHPSLQKGWLRLPFRPVPLTNPLKGESQPPPSFRVGATEARSETPEDLSVPSGAAGTMAIPIPPSVTKITRLRVAGEKNEGQIEIELLLGGWNFESRKHHRLTLVNEKITSEPYCETFLIKETELHPEFYTLSLWVRGTGKTAVSLIAVEFIY